MSGSRRVLNGGTFPKKRGLRWNTAEADSTSQTQARRTLGNRYAAASLTDVEGEVLLVFEVGRGEADGLTGDGSRGGVAQGLSVRRVDVDDEVAGKRRFEVDGDVPGAVGFGKCGPAEAAEASGALPDSDFFARCEPVLGRGLLQVADGGVIFLITEQPAKTHSRLQYAVDDSGPSVAAAL